MNDVKIMPKTVSAQAIRRVVRLTSAAIVAMGLWSGSVLAKDPFRSANPRPINANTQAAFEAFFKQGDYKSAANYLKQLDPADPLSLAMRASLSYSDMLGERDQARKATLLEEFQSFANQTRTAAERLVGSDPLRGNLYLAVSHFFDGVYAFTKEGTVKGTAKVLGELQQIIKYLNDAEAKSPNDPELNLLRGYIDVYSGIYLPFSSPDKGIARLQQFASPRYLADRGLAMGYLEMKEYDKAMTSVDSAIAAAPENPELWYLKSRILAKQGKDQDSIPYLEKAIAKKDQLPVGLVREMERALRKTRERLGQAGK
jgi:tetratricopeptide (TPR) repeat protein